MSLADQLKKLALPITTSFAAESVRHKSLVYDNASKVDTLTCYQDSLKSFKRLAKRDDAFSSFRTTIFAETSCRLEICNLYPEEKQQLDSQISQFLCLLSPYLRQLDALWCLEWLVHKFLVHIHYVDQYIQCIFPYHETGLFIKCLQLLDFQTCESTFRWLKPYAKFGNPVSRPQLVRECLHQPDLLSFLTSMILNAVKYSKGFSPNRLNDMSNFFLSTMTAFCDSSIPDDKLARIVDNLQHLIRRGLRAIDCPPFQSATFLVVLRLSLKLKLNHELVFSWIGCILKRTKPSTAWESLRLVNKLKFGQSLALLPPKLDAKFSELLNQLSEAERKLIEDEEESDMLNLVDPNKIAEDAALTSAAVQAATVSIDLDALVYQPTSPISKKFHSSDATLFANNQTELQVVHAVLNATCTLRTYCVFSGKDDHCESCPPLSSVRYTHSWLSDLLVLILPTTQSIHKISKIEVRRCRRVLFLMKSAVHIHCDQAAPQSANLKYRPSNNLLSTLESGLDNSLPILLCCLLHPAGSIRSGVYVLISKWLNKLVKNGWSPNSSTTPHLSLLFNRFNLIPDREQSLDNVDVHMPSFMIEQLKGDPLSALIGSLTSLRKVVMEMLLNEPIPINAEDKPPSLYTFLCWSNGIQLISPDTMPILLSVHDPQSNSLVGWSGFLALLRCTHESYTTLHLACLSLLSESTFGALESAMPNISFSPGGVANRSGQNELLDALCDLALVSPTDSAMLHTIMKRFPLTVQHFDYLLLKLDAVRMRSQCRAGQSLFARVNAARKARRLRNFASNLDATQSEMITSLQADSDANRLQLLSTVLSVFTDFIPRLQLKAISDQQSRAAATSSQKSEQSKIGLLTQSIPDISIRSKGLIAVPPSSLSSSPHSSLISLFTPLIGHLINLLTQEQRLRAVSASHSSDSSDSDSDHMSGSDQHHIIDFDLGVAAEDKTCDHELELVDHVEPNMHALVRHCVYRIVVALTIILANCNQSNNPEQRPKRPHRSQSTSSLCSSVQLTLESMVDPVFHCLSVYPEWTALHQQVLLCFVELSSLVPVVLCQRLLTLVQWVAHNPQLMRLDTTHSLSLLGRLIVISIPALIRASTDQTKAALEVTILFVDAFPGLSTKLPRRRLAFYTGLVRGLAQVTGPLTLESICSPPPKSSATKSDKLSRKHERRQQRALLERCKENWKSSWLWAVALMFLNRNWRELTDADAVASLLVDVHNQFAWDVQVASWYECLTFLLWLNDNSAEVCKQTSNSAVRLKTPFSLETPTRKLELVDTEIPPPPKRRRTTSTECQSGAANETSITSTFSTDIYFNQSSSFRVMQPLLSCLFMNKESKNPLNANSDAPSLNPAAMWSLTSRAVQLLTVLLADPTYDHKLQAASDDPLGFGAVYGRLVQQATRLMLTASVAVSSSKVEEVDDQNNASIVEGAKEALTGLQKVLIQIHDSVSGHIFVRMISDFFNSSHRGLHRKALELLSAKLTSLCANCQPISILDSTSNPRSSHSPSLDLTLEAGLVQLTARLSFQYKSDSNQSGPNIESMQLKCIHSHQIGSSYSRQSISCLRDLAKLLSARYPGEFMRTLDIFLAKPVFWWPIRANISKANEPRGSGSAEARSLVCLFFVECLQRLPSEPLCPDAKSTTTWLGTMLVFALDHLMTSCRLSQSPILTLRTFSVGETEKSSIITGQVHSREQHLQAALSLLQNLLELATVHRRAQLGTDDTFIRPSARCHWLQFESPPDRDPNTSMPISDVLLNVIFHLTQIDLAAATGANPERVGSILKQVSTTLNLVDRLLIHVTPLDNLLSSVYRVFLMATANSDLTVIQGSLLFLREVAEATINSQSPFNINREFLQLCDTKPDWIQKIILSIVQSVVKLASIGDSLHSVGCTAIASILAAMPNEIRIRLSLRLLEWATQLTSKKPIELASVHSTLLHLGTVYCVLSEISNRILPADFSELTKQLSLIDYLVLTFHIFTGQNRKRLRKLGERLNLKSCVGFLNQGLDTSVRVAIGSSIECLRKWLITELQTNACLDIASGGNAVLELPETFISLLDVCQSSSPTQPVLNENDLSTALDALVDAITGDEALLRPLGTALTTRIVHGAHWQVRLSAILLLKRLFNRLLSDQAEGAISQGAITAQCLVSDTLSALSEALEDDRPEVETAANKMFAELEQSGINT